MWLLNVNFVVQEKKNEVIQKNQQTNIRIWVPSTILCPTKFDNSLDFSISINLKTKKAVSDSGIILPNVFINDNIGLFNSPAWTKNPILEISSTDFVSS
jgi:glutaredoxin